VFDDRVDPRATVAAKWSSPSSSTICAFGMCCARKRPPSMGATRSPMTWTIVVGIRKAGRSARTSASYMLSQINRAAAGLVEGPREATRSRNASSAASVGAHMSQNHRSASRSPIEEATTRSTNRRHSLTVMSNPYG